MVTAPGELPYQNVTGAPEQVGPQARVSCQPGQREGGEWPASRPGNRRQRSQKTIPALSSLQGAAQGGPTPLAGSSLAFSTQPTLQPDSDPETSTDQNRLERWPGCGQCGAGPSDQAVPLFQSPQEVKVALPQAGQRIPISHSRRL